MTPSCHSVLNVNKGINPTRQYNKNIDAFKNVVKSCDTFFGYQVDEFFTALESIVKNNVDKKNYALLEQFAFDLYVEILDWQKSSALSASEIALRKLCKDNCPEPKKHPDDLSWTKLYRKTALILHPDKGGDTKLFQQLSQYKEAVETEVKERLNFQIKQSDTYKAEIVSLHNKVRAKDLEIIRKANAVQDSKNLRMSAIKNLVQGKLFYRLSVASTKALSTLGTTAFVLRVSLWYCCRVIS